MDHIQESQDDGFTSITWDNANPSPSPVSGHDHPQQAPPGTAMHDPVREGDGSTPTWKGRWMQIVIRDPVREHEGSKDSYVSYCVKTRVS